jgi:MFS family permease
MSRTADELHRTFRAARASRNFRLYLFGQLTSATGTWMNFTASSWLVLQLTHDGVAVGLNVALMFGPILLLGAFGGVLADRFDKRRILTWTQTGYAVVALTLALLVTTNVIELWMIYLLSLAAGVVTALDNPARQSFYVEMVGEENLTNAVSLNSAAFTGARIVGPAVAGVLIATVGIGICFLIDGLSYFAVIASLLVMRTAELHPQKRSTRDRGHLVAGLRYVWQTDELRRPLMVLIVIFTLAFQLGVMMPLLAERAFGGSARTFGVLSALGGVGSFAGAIIMANRNVRPTMRRLGLWAIGLGLCFGAVGASPDLLLAGAAMVALGFSSMGFMITGNTILQVNARPEARGRVMALYGMVFLGSTPIGSPIVGWIAQHVGPRAPFVVSAVCCVAVGATVLWARQRGTVAEASAVEPAAPIQANEPISVESA